MTLLTIQDELTSGAQPISTTIEIPDERIAVEELIRSHVFQRVKDTNATIAQRPSPAPFVQPTEYEVALNGIGKADEFIRWQDEFEKTKKAFLAKQIFVLVDDKQVMSLDDVITVKPSTRVRFLRLTMLMGG